MAADQAVSTAQGPDIGEPAGIYREAFGLLRDYPTVAATFAEKRSNLAEEIGLGRKSKQEALITPRTPRSEKAAPTIAKPSTSTP